MNTSEGVENVDVVCTMCSMCSTSLKYNNRLQWMAVAMNVYG